MITEKDIGKRFRFIRNQTKEESISTPKTFYNEFEKRNVQYNTNHLFYKGFFHHAPFYVHSIQNGYFTVITATRKEGFSEYIKNRCNCLELAFPVDSAESFIDPNFPEII